MAALLPISPLAARTTQDEQVWLNATVMGSVSGRLLYFAEVQPRFVDGVGRLGQLILRPAVGWKLSPAVSVYQGYAHVVQPVPGGADVREDRFYQQLSWTMGAVAGGTLSSRTRLEQRLRSDGGDLGWRLREMLRYVHPLGGGARSTRALVSVEGMAAFNDTDWGARAGFDQVRTFMGAEIPLRGRSTIEAGYLNQTIDRPRGLTAVNHVASISLFIRP